MLDEDGVLTLVGRSSELIITGGYNVYPREVEDVLHSHAGISDVAVVGVRDDTWGERVVAAVVPAATPADVEPPTAALADGLAALADRELAPYKRPREYVVVSGIPRNPLGKILRAEVRGLIASDPSARGDS
jgi:acyl-CoA synthetase (AMP-forming)/AMP-acid ligase II